MNKVENMAVRDVRGRGVGAVAALNDCCIQVRGTGLAIQREGILGADQFGFELVCDYDQVQRYACPIHQVWPVRR